MSAQTVLASEAALRAHFQGAVSEALQNQRVEATPASREYLSSLLHEFTRVAVVPAADPEVRFLHRPLVELLAEAQAVRGAERLARLRTLGDLALWFSGYYPEALARRPVDVDYYVAMGGHAYQRIAMDLEATGRQTLFEELSRKFARFVDVISEVSARDAGRRKPGLLALYERWLRSRSTWAARALCEQGFVPFERDPDDGLPQ